MWLLQIGISSIFIMGSLYSSFRCSSCPFTSPFTPALFAHLELAHGRTMRHCKATPDCGYATTEADDLALHIAHVHDDGNGVSNNKSKVNNVSRGSTNSISRKGNKTSISSSKIHSHHNSKSKVIMNNSSINNMRKRRFPCQRCTYVALKRFTLAQHVSSVHEGARNYR